MKLLQAMAGAEFGGAEDFFTRLAVALEKTEIEQRVLVRPHPARLTALRTGGVDVATAPYGGALDFTTKWALWRQIQAFKPDIVLSWMNRASAFCPRGKFVHVGRHGGYYDLKYYKNCDHIIGNTEDIVAVAVENGWPGDKAHYLPNFVDAAAKPPQRRAELYTPNDAPLVLALGRLHENKAFDVLLRALARRPEFYLWLAGEGPLRGELERLAEDLGVKPRVRFLGWREDTAALYGAADVFVCPSRHEPLGNVVIEAWAHGVPVIAADSFGPGMLIDHLENGILVPVDDDATMAKAMRSVIDDRDFAARIATAGHQVYDDHFTEQRVVARFLDFFESVTR